MPADAKRKEARKRKFGTQTTEPKPEPRPVGTLIVEQERSKTVVPPPKRSKRAQSSQQGSEHTISTDKDGGHEDQALQKAQRFIVFIGNLPFTATDASIRRHFAKVHPKSIRHRTDKETGKSKGYAFLEFAGYDHMKTCLKLFHQSAFDDGETPARKLNVELTAGGGGGKSTDRKAKLRVKNERLNEQRKRRIQEKEKQDKKVTTEKAAESAAVTADNGDIHPSRRSRVTTMPNDT